ncbi:MAG: hypothetical protein WAN43_15390 [Rhodomicrobium sp.]
MGNTPRPPQAKQSSPLIGSERRDYLFLFLVAILAVAIEVAKRYTSLLSYISADTVQNLTQALYGFLLLGWFGDYLTKMMVKETIIDTLGSLFTSDRTIFSQLSAKTRNAIVQNVLQVALPAEFADAVYQDVVKDYLEGEREFRRDFSYSIRFLDVYHLNTPMVKGPLYDVVDKLNNATDEYLWVRQNMSYTHHLFHTVQDPFADGNLKICFALTDVQLERFVHDDSIFFREVLQLDHQTVECLKACSTTELRSFVEDVLDFEISPTNKVEPLKYLVDWVSDPQGEQYIQITASSNRGVTGCRIKFSHPHRRKSNHFLVTMPKPMQKGASILFEAAPSMKSISEIIFLPNDSYKIVRSAPSSNKGEVISLETLRWTFPTSGMVLIWEAAPIVPKP